MTLPTTMTLNKAFSNSGICCSSSATGPQAVCPKAIGMYSSSLKTLPDQLPCSGVGHCDILKHYCS